MKVLAHAAMAAVMAITTLSILIVTQVNDSVKPLDTVRFYTKKWEKGDTDRATALLRDSKASVWLSPECQASTNLTLDPTCLEKRTIIRDGILAHMRCTEYGSQACSYIRRMLKALVRTGTDRVQPTNASSPFKLYGTNLKGIASNGETYRDILIRVVQEAQRMFHGAFRAEESDKTLVLRSALYNLITWTIAGNLFMHVADSFHITRQTRLVVRTGTFLVVFITAAIFFFVNMGNALVLGLIILSGGFNLAYFEMFLDPTIVRPWIHPFAFTTIYISTTILALVENGVFDYNIILTNILIAMAAAQMFMSMVWYNVGYSEKIRMNSRLYIVYTTKEANVALLGSILMQFFIPLHLLLAPYNFTFKSVFLALAPLIFAVMSVVCTTYIQSMPLGDSYGEDAERKRNRATAANLHKGDVMDATEINGAKLFCSLLLLFYGAVITLIYLSDHITTYRAYLDAMPESSIQYDTATPTRMFLMGQGLTPM